MKQVKAYILYTILMLLSVNTLSAYADTPSIKTEIYNTQAGSPEEPKNIKLRITLPKSYSKTTFTPEDLHIFIYPQALDINTGKREKYQAKNLMLWQYNNNLFIDIRQPPQQRNGGNHTLYFELSKNQHTIYKSELSQAIRYDYDEADVVLIIDSSFSMHKNDPNNNRLHAAKAFVDIARADKRIRNIGIVSFNNRATIVAPLTPVRNSRRLHNAIDSIGSAGQTNIGTALESGLEVLDIAKSKRTAVVLLTDGKNESTTYQNQHLDFAKRKIPVYCIGLSDNADTKLLDTIATDTNAKSFRASNNQELLGIYQRIASTISRREVIFNKSIPFSQNKIGIPVDSTIKNISFMLNSNNGEADLKLINPEGKKVNTEISTHNNYKEIRIHKPQPGLWTAVIKNRLTRRSLEINVTGDTSLYLDSFPPLIAGHNVWLTGTLANNAKAITNAQVRAISYKGQIQLFDDGKHNDGRAKDGVYTCSFPIIPEDNFDILLRAWGTAKLPYLRQVDAGKLKGQSIESEEPQVQYALTAETTAPFTTAMAGENTTQKVNLNYAGLPKKISAKFSQLHNSIYTIDSSALSIDLTNIEEGSNATTITLAIPPQMPSGEYTGTVEFITADTSAALPLKINLINPQLLVEQDNINLGYINEGERKSGTFTVTLQAPYKHELHILTANHNFEITAEPQILLPNKKQLVKYTVVGSKLNNKEEQQQEIILQAGDTQKNIILSYQIMPKGKEQSTMLLAHELSIPEEKVVVATQTLAHEMTFPAPITKVTIQTTPTPVVSLVHELDPQITTPIIAKPAIETGQHLTTATTVDKTVLQAMDTEEHFLLFLIIIATVALVFILLLLRKLSRHRMIRIALLSLALHLPLIAFITSYILVTRDIPVIKNSNPAPIASMVDDDSFNNAIVTENISTLQKFNNTALEPNESPITSAVLHKADIGDIFESVSKETTPLPINSPRTVTAILAEPALDFDTLLQDAEKPLFNEKHTSEKISAKDENWLKHNSPLANIDRIPTIESLNNYRQNPKITDEEIPLALNSALTKNTESTESADPLYDIDNIIDDLDITDQEKPTANRALTTVAIRPITANDVVDSIGNIPHINQKNNSTSAEVSLNTKQPELSRDLNTEIETTLLLRSISNNAPAAQEPSRLLTSIDKTAPIEIKTEDLDTTALFQEPDLNINHIFSIDNTDNSHNPIIFETTPKIATPQIMEIDPISKIPTITTINNLTPKKNSNALPQLSNTEQKERNTIDLIPLISPEVTESITSATDEINIPNKGTLKISEDSSVLESSIELPSEDALNIEIATTSKPNVIASIDDLDLNIEQKMRRLQINNSEIELNRDINTTPDKILEEYIPSRPDVDKIASAEVAAIPTPAPTVKVTELPAINDKKFNFTESDINYTRNISAIATRIKKPKMINENPVKIVNSPKSLNSYHTSKTKLQKSALTSAESVITATDSNIDSITINIGLLTSNSDNYINNLPHLKHIKTKIFNDSTEDIFTCQLVIANKERLSPKDLQLLAKYVEDGGHLWIQDQGIPQELASIGNVTKIPADDKVFNSIYTIANENLLFAEELRTNSQRSILATGCRDDRTNVPLLTNVFTTFLGEAPTAEPQKEPAIIKEAKIWQNFSGIDQSMLIWKGPKWGNTVFTGLAPDGQGGEALRVSIKAGTDNFTSINYIIPDYEGRRIDLSTNKAVILDIYNASRKIIELSLGLTTNSPESGWNEFETKKIALKSGWNRNVSIPLQNFRSRHDEENNYTHQLAAANNCARVSFYLNNIKDGGNFLIDNIKWKK